VGVVEKAEGVSVIMPNIPGLGTCDFAAQERVSVL
jgi:hypothetical protein